MKHKVKEQAKEKAKASKAMGWQRLRQRKPIKITLKAPKKGKSSTKTGRCRKIVVSAKVIPDNASFMIGAPSSFAGEDFVFFEGVIMAVKFLRQGQGHAQGGYAHNDGREHEHLR